jgi:hypothetical protein
VVAEREPIPKVMNGVARSFWREVFDLQGPVQDDRRAKRNHVRRKKLRRTLANPSRQVRRG